ncbi:MAG: cytochrome B [Alphaproteobacteria bacterium]|nr:MAG: cytochrome B [Alphaproteobacteria bacterium]
MNSDGRPGARTFMVWDPVVRLIHWGVALTVLLNGAITEEDGITHEWVGYVGAGLVVTRLVWGLIGTRYARFTAFWPSISRARQYLESLRRGDRTVHLAHNPLGTLMVYNMWATVLFLGLTGYLMTTPAFFGSFWVEGLHALAFNWLVLCVIVHVAAVIYDTRRSGVNLVRAMIDGRKHVPEDRPIE